MHFIVYSDYDEDSIGGNLGRAEYSYYFALKAFYPALERLGSVQLVQRPELEVDPIFKRYRERGEPCIFLSFSPPNKTCVDLRCPTVVVFAWEYTNIPNETWDDDPRNDWRWALRKLGRAITHCRSAVLAVRTEMGAEFPIAAITAPVWERFSDFRRRHRPAAQIREMELTLGSRVVDSWTFDLSADLLVPPFPYCLPATPRKHRLAKRMWDAVRGGLPDWLRAAFSRSRRRAKRLARAVEVPLPPITVAPPENTLSIGGVIYTSVFNPIDGRKNWSDMVTAFCFALRDAEDAALILKMVHYDAAICRENLKLMLSQLAPFKCRVIGVEDFLDEKRYERLIEATSYYVNTSAGEGQCLPMMEFMACGKPAVAPRHTGMADYIDEEDAFIINASREYSVWPHDPRQMFRSERFRVDWESIVAAYRDSYRVAKEDPERYQAMARQATDRLRQHASVATAVEKMRKFCAADMAGRAVKKTRAFSAGAVAEPLLKERKL